jgi:hypothetical protein
MSSHKGKEFNHHSLDPFEEKISELKNCLKKLKLSVSQLYSNRTAFCMCSCLLDCPHHWSLDHGFCDKLQTLGSLWNPKCFYQYSLPIASLLKELLP